MPAAARRLRLPHRVPDCAHVGGQPRAAHLRRHQRNHEGVDRMDVVDRFEAQAARAPAAIAVSCGEERLAYGELNARANRVAHYLRGRGVGRDTLVGVAMRRSPLLVCALLGVWKAGAAYVPLDPSYPRARLDFMLRDANAGVLLEDRTFPDPRELLGSARAPARNSRPG